MSISVLQPGPVVADSEPDFSTVEQHFRTLPMEARRLTGPLFWLDGDEEQDLLETYVDKVVEGGNGSFTPESRPHADWLGPDWFNDLAILLDKAKEHDLEMWIFDEKWWPSGMVGGKVPAKYASKNIEGLAITVEGPKAFEHESVSENLIAVIAGRVQGDGVDSSSLIDLSDHVNNGIVKWDAPAGKWSVMIFTWKLADKHWMNCYLVDGASKDAANWLIETVYQPHYDHFKEDFGSTIVGYFYDEPETLGDWGTEVIPMLKERNVDWKKALVAKKFTLADPQEQVAAAYQYQDAYAEAWGRTLFGGVTKWCHERNVRSIGHWLEHEYLYFHKHYCAGNMFQVQKYSDMGGIDAVFSQFVAGERNMGNWQIPKLGSSISHAYGKKDDLAMVEIFGARGQDLTYPEMKWWTDHMHVSGINFHIPHAFNPKSPFDTDCPPYFYNNGYEPRWPLYRVYADYTSRLSTMLTGGRHVCPVAFIYMGNSIHVGKALSPEIMSTALQDALFDCDWLPYDVLENDMTIDGSELTLRDERYRVLVVPAVEVMPYESLAKIKSYYDAGGIVVGYGILPRLSATLGRSEAEIAALRSAIWGDSPQMGLNVCRTNAAGGRSYFLPEQPTPEHIKQVLTNDAGIRPTFEVREGDTENWLHVLHRVKSGRDVFFVTDQNYDGKARTYTLRLHATGEPELWDAMRNEICTVDYDRVDEDTVDIKATLHSNESVLFVFNNTRRDLPKRVDWSNATAVKRIELERQPNPPKPESSLESELIEQAKLLEGLFWIWYPEGEGSHDIPPGKHFFRKQIELPTGRTIESAQLLMTADNEFACYINEEPVLSGIAWNQLYQAEVSEIVTAGNRYQLAIVAHNKSAEANPAGLIGRLKIVFDDASSMVVDVDQSWKCSDSQQSGWMSLAFDDANWKTPRIVAAYGDQPWGHLAAGSLTVSPVEEDIYAGRFTLPPDINPAKHRIYLEAEDIGPEPAAHVTVNGEYVGGFISRPLRLEIGGHTKSGKNEIVIKPFAPTSPSIAVYRK